MLSKREITLIAGALLGVFIGTTTGLLIIQKYKGADRMNEKQFTELVACMRKLQKATRKRYNLEEVRMRDDLEKQVDEEILNRLKLQKEQAERAEGSLF